MKCFYDAADAVGICKHCGRGVCQESAVTVSTALACKNRCEDDVKILMAVMARQKTLYPRTAAVYWRNAVLFTVMGVVVLSFANWQQDYLGPMSYLLAAFGLLMLLGAGFNFYNGRKFHRA